MATALAIVHAPAAALPPSAEWRFTVLLDARVIGTHRFALAATSADAAILESDARFDVTVLGLPVYRWRHHSKEQWQGDCIASIDATTDDQGRTTTLRGAQEADGFALEVRPGSGDSRADARRTVTPACLMSFAYWHPALAAQRQLLDPATGRLERVTIAPVPEARIEVDGRPSIVRGLRIAGLPQPIDVWYLGTRWVGLDTVVAGGRQLSYRLR